MGSLRGMMLVALLAACSSCGRIPGVGGPREQRTELVAPAGASWDKAVLRVLHTTAGKGGINSSPSDPAVVVELLLTVAGKEHVHHLDYILPTRKEYPALRFRDAVVRMAPDGHALAICYRVDNEWSYVGLENPAEPLYCTHRKIKTASLEDDPFAKAPTTRELALEILAGIGFEAGPQHVHKPDRQDRRAGTEIVEAAEYTRQHLDDPELRAAIIDGLVRPPQDDSDLSISDRPVPTIAGLAADVDPPGLARMLAAAKTASVKHRGHLMTALAQTRHESVQVALAEMLANAKPDEERRSDFAWALESITLRRSAAPPVAIQGLVAALGDADPWVQVFAARALAVIPTDEVRGALDRAGEPCAHHEFADKMESHYDDAGALNTYRIPPACWAREARRRNGKLEPTKADAGGGSAGDSGAPSGAPPPR